MFVQDMVRLDACAMTACQSQSMGALPDHVRFDLSWNFHERYERPDDGAQRWWSDRIMLDCGEGTQRRYGTQHRKACCLFRWSPTNSTNSLEHQMSKSKREKAAKRAREPKIAARAHRNKQAVVRSAKENLLRSVAAGSIEPALELHDNLKQEAPIVENQAAALQDSSSSVTKDDNLKKVFDLPSAMPNTRGYQAKLLEIGQANMQFALELGQRLATIRSPFEFFAVITEFSSRRINMFRKYSKEMAD